MPRLIRQTAHVHEGSATGFRESVRRFEETTETFVGVPLKKVLKFACGGVLPECKHLEFIGADTYFKYVQLIHLCCRSFLTFPRRKGDVYNYAVSVPWRKVRNNEEVLLAWEMNGEPLPKIHGYPLRVVVTGYIGARSCKWLYKINCLAEPSMGPVQSQEYLYYTSQVRYGFLGLSRRSLGRADHKRL